MFRLGRRFRRDLRVGFLSGCWNCPLTDEHFSLVRSAGAAAGRAGGHFAAVPLGDARRGSVLGHVGRAVPRPPPGTDRAPFLFPFQPLYNTPSQDTITVERIHSCSIKMIT